MLVTTDISAAKKLLPSLALSKMCTRAINSQTVVPMRSIGRLLPVQVRMFGLTGWKPSPYCPTWHAISEIHACCDAIDLRPAAAVQPNRGLSEKRTFADWAQRKFVARSMIC